MNYGMKQAFKRRLKDSMASIGIFVGVMLVIMLALLVGLLAFLDSDNSIGGNIMFFGFAAGVTAFVMGICTIRDDLRLFIQHGVGRKTTFRVEMAVILLTSFALAIVGDLMITLGQVIASVNDTLVVSDFYQMLYLNDTMGQVMALPDHIMNILFIAFMFCAAEIIGMFVSLGYYHLNKAWTITVSIGVPLLLVFGLPALSLSALGSGMEACAAVFLNPWIGLVCLIVTSAVFAAFNWLLMRRVSIRPAKG